MNITKPASVQVIHAIDESFPKTVPEFRSAHAGINQWRSAGYNEFLNDLKGFNRLDFFIAIPYHAGFLARFAQAAVKRFTAAIRMALYNSDVQAGFPG